MFEKIDYPVEEIEKNIKEFKNEQNIINFINDIEKYMELYDDFLKSMNIPIYARIFYVHNYLNLHKKDKIQNWNNVQKKYNLNIFEDVNQIIDKLSHLKNDTNEYILLKCCRWYYDNYINFGFDSYSLKNTISFPLLENEELLIVYIAKTGLFFHNDLIFPYVRNRHVNSKLSILINETDYMYLNKFIYIAEEYISNQAESIRKKLNELLEKIIMDYDKSTYSISKGDFSYSAWDSLQAIEKIIKFVLITKGAEEKDLKNINHYLDKALKEFNNKVEQNKNLNTNYFNLFMDKNVDAASRYGNKNNITIKESTNMNYKVLDLMRFIVTNEIIGENIL